MKFIQSSLFRALCAIIVGFLLIKYRENMVSGMIVAIGVLFFISGVISCAAYYVQKKSAEKQIVDDTETAPLRPTFPFAGLGSLILGIILASMPDTFVEWLSYILLAIIIIGALNEIVSLVVARRYGPVSPVFWIVPIVMLVAAIAFIAHPQFILTAPFFFIGWAMIIFGAAQCVNAIKIYSLKRKFQKKEQELQAIEAESAEETEQTIDIS